jgi:nucleotide-binding universal stress UspA family protein
MRSWLKILCAVDFSESSRVALEDAADLARRFGAELALVHVREPTAGVASELELPAERLEQETVELGRKLDNWKREAERIAGREVRAVLVGGSPAAEIVRIAGSERFDLVIAGTHGRKALGRLLLGSVAEKLVRETPCPVLVSKRAPEWGD